MQDSGRMATTHPSAVGQTQQPTHPGRAQVQPGQAQRAEGQAQKVQAPGSSAQMPAKESPAPQAPGPENQAAKASPSGPAAQALVPAAPLAKEETAAQSQPFGASVVRLPVEIDVVLPVREFRVRHLLALEPGQVIESEWSYSDAVPVTAGDVQLAWSEFEVIDEQLAVRVTRLP